jgi:hypothetical protein
MRLKELDARLLRRLPDGVQVEVDSLADADGVMFQCPRCASKCEAGSDDKGRRFFVGAHYVLCWFAGRVPDDADPKPGRWRPSGTGLDDLTFVGPGAASVLLTSGCKWHGFVRGGAAE